jgi:hypothetical protein
MHSSGIYHRKNREELSYNLGPLLSSMRAKMHSPQLYREKKSKREDRWDIAVYSDSGGGGVQ